jgi:hypothetical protein
MNIPAEDFTISQNNKNIQTQIQGDFDIHSHHINYMRKSSSVGGLKSIKQVRKSLSPVIHKETKEKSDLKFKYSSKPTSRSEK